MVRAYWFAMEKVAPGETLNVSTGTGYSILEILNTLIKSSPKSIHIEVDDKKLRPVDIPVFIGDSCRFQSLTGWKPEISMEKTLADLLDYWRNEIQKKERYS
jgi:GDP-4-dehydro-6-deoxy-D-mannose reductase